MTDINNLFRKLGRTTNTVHCLLKLDKCKGDNAYSTAISLKGHREGERERGGGDGFYCFIRTQGNKQRSIQTGICKFLTYTKGHVLYTVQGEDLLISPARSTDDRQIFLTVSWTNRSLSTFKRTFSPVRGGLEEVWIDRPNFGEVPTVVYCLSVIPSIFNST
jgi:hypothetical protein